MWRIFAIALCLGIGVLVLEAVHYAMADHNPHPDVHPIRELPQIAGRPYEEVQAIVARHRSELMQVPHVYIVGVGGKGILVGVYVYTDSQGKKPTTLPASLDALPADVEGLPLQVVPLYVLPPPPGVTILRPNGVREAAEACPRTFLEHSKFGWTFCIDRRHPQSIPTLMTPPIAGIPYEECLKILERHRDALIQLDGVDGVGLGAEGIDVYTSKPDIVPLELGGLPVKTKPPLGPARGASHTASNPPVRPLHGGVAMGISGSAIRGTLTEVQLASDGILIYTEHPDLLPELPIKAVPPLLIE